MLNELIEEVSKNNTLENQNKLIGAITKAIIEENKLEYIDFDYSYSKNTHYYIFRIINCNYIFQLNNDFIGISSYLGKDKVISQSLHFRNHNLRRLYDEVLVTLYELKQEYSYIDLENYERSVYINEIGKNYLR